MYSALSNYVFVVALLDRIARQIHSQSAATIVIVAPAPTPSPTPSPSPKRTTSKATNNFFLSICFSHYGCRCKIQASTLISELIACIPYFNYSHNFGSVGFKTNFDAVLHKFVFAWMMARWKILWNPLYALLYMWHHSSHLFAPPLFHSILPGSPTSFSVYIRSTSHNTSIEPTLIKWFSENPPAFLVWGFDCRFSLDQILIMSVAVGSNCKDILFDGIGAIIYVLSPSPNESHFVRSVI